MTIIPLNHRECPYTYPEFSCSSCGKRYEVINPFTLFEVFICHNKNCLRRSSVPGYALEEIKNNIEYKKILEEKSDNAKRKNTRGGPRATAGGYTYNDADKHAKLGDSPQDI
jgi:hypothetical protein